MPQGVSVIFYGEKRKKERRGDLKPNFGRRGKFFRYERLKVFLLKKGSALSLNTNK